MRKYLFVFSFAGAVSIAAFACSDDSSTDGGTDATTEPTADLCDVTVFSGNGNACPHASTRICFQICEASDPGGCICTATANGPIWMCTYPPDCVPCNSSPVADAACPDASDGAVAPDANDASDASDDGSDESDAADAADAISE